MRRTQVDKNQTKFGHYYILANTRLMEALVEPSQRAFDHAYAAALRAIDSSFSNGHESIELDLGQKLAQTISATANRFGYRVV
jgi:hypothetical protein